MTTQLTNEKPVLRFNRGEWAGAFGDIGTDLPLLVAMLAVTGLAAGPVFFGFGLALIISGWIYRLPMPVQPLKAMAVVVIAGQATGPQLQLAGLLLGAVMLVLALSGALSWLVRVIPRCVVRGVQVGLALHLGWAALRMAGKEGAVGWLVAIVALGALLWLRSSQRWPGGLLVVGAGLLWTLGTQLDWATAAVRPALTELALPELPWSDWSLVLALLVLPQLPLSLSNSLVATQRTVADLFPDRPVSARGLGVTFAGLNFLSPVLGSVPVCHGCGGLAGHYALGARTGGSVMIYGAVFLLGGALFGGSLAEIARLFPFPLLGALLLLESGVLVSLARDQVGSPALWLVTAPVALCCFFLSYGYLIGAVVGIILYHVFRLPTSLRVA